MLHILHNPRCGKSRNCLLFLEESKVPYEIIHYLDNPLSAEELKALIQKLHIKPIELIRQKEAIWIEKYQGKKMSNTAIINAMVKYPILMQRPIVIDGDRAIIGRELDTLNDFI